MAGERSNIESRILVAGDATKMPVVNRDVGEGDWVRLPSGAGPYQVTGVGESDSENRRRVDLIPEGGQRGKDDVFVTVK